MRKHTSHRPSRGWKEYHLIREMSRVLSDTFRKCVVVVDTTSELGGFGALPHSALGVHDMTRLQVHMMAVGYALYDDPSFPHHASLVESCTLGVPRVPWGGAKTRCTLCLVGLGG